MARVTLRDPYLLSNIFKVLKAKNSTFGPRFGVHLVHKFEDPQSSTHVMTVEPLNRTNLPKLESAAILRLLC